MGIYGTIQIKIETRERLKQLGVKGESYDRIIQRLLIKNNDSDNPTPVPRESRIATESIAITQGLKQT